MANTVGEYLLRRLRSDWGVRRIYGYPGDGINGILGAFHALGDDLDFIQVRHEEIAAFAATAHAKVTGEVGVCLATSGPGALHLLNALYDAKLDHQPVRARTSSGRWTAGGGSSTTARTRGRTRSTLSWSSTSSATGCRIAPSSPPTRGALRRPLVEPPARRVRAQQRRPQPGHLGAAGDERRPQARGVPGAAALRLRGLCAADRPA